ncbi:WD40 repeat domain-containing protein [Candidatus Uabimicrobium amorphum]|uniref:Peptidase C14 caspase domain-containing protein n=1 Tax=Uabimicrobium amorphum TaxID=2596890 RepID=A0A5S9IQQ1_UABAM|nr:WD40 repeat domain-containing protein [Candidatus Uabimicrobium amorphum]BBM86154.1 hypothetical protein UABAM_04540 [Candidatus Uabimicrobium amorphum]
MKNIFIYVLFLSSCVFSQNDEKISAWITQLQNPDQCFFAIEKLKAVGPQAKKAIPFLKTVLQKALRDNDTRLFNAVFVAIAEITPDIMQTAQEKSTTHNKQRSIAKKSYENFGGLTVLGLSQDFRQKLRYNRSHAVIVGINRYKHHPSLHGASYDAAEIAAVLASRYGYHNITLITDTLPQKIYPLRYLEEIASNNVYTTYRHRLNKENIVVVHPRHFVTGELIEKCISRIKVENKYESLFFFYAGHGIPGSFVLGDSPKNSGYPLAKIANTLSEVKAHHTLMVLDSCFSGSLLQNPHRPQLQGYRDQQLLFGRGENIDRVFARRSFQVITAGTGSEAVEDQLSNSTRYAQLTGEGEHSPFTAVFLQAIKGLAGRADGIQLASDLGYYMMSNLVNDRRIQASQAPRYSSLAGDGDFMLFPKDLVLNPKLIAPLYLDEKSYADIRIATCEALKSFILEQPQQQRLALTKSAMPHVGKLLQESRVKTQVAAVTFIRDMLKRFPAQKVNEVQAFVLPITQLLANTNHQESSQIRLLLSCLGKMSFFATPQSMDVLKNLVEKHYIRDWQQIDKQELPNDVKDYVQRLENLKLADANTQQQQMDYWIEKGVIYEWLTSTGKVHIANHKDRLEKRHQQGLLLLKNAKKLYEEKDFFTAHFTMARATNFANVDKTPARKSKFLKNYSKEWFEAYRLLNSNLHCTLQWQNAAFSQHTGAVTCIDKNQQNTLLASGSSDKTIKLWDLQSRKLRAVLYGHKEKVNAVCFHPQEEVLFSAGDDALIVWELKTHSKKMELTGHTEHITSLALSPDGVYLASADTDGNIHLWDTKTYENKRSFPAKGHINISSLSFISKNTLAFTKLQKNTFFTWNIKTGKQKEFIGHKQQVNHVIGNDSFLLSASRDKTVKMWDFKTQKLRHTFSHPNIVRKLALSQENILATACGDKTIRLWDLSNKKLRHTMHGHKDATQALLFTPRHLISANNDYTIGLWDLNTGKPLRDYKNYYGTPVRSVLSEDGKTFAVGYSSGSIRLWDTKSGKSTLSLHGLSNWPLAIALSPDGKKLGAVSRNIIFVWDTKTGKPLRFSYGRFGRSVNIIRFGTKSEQFFFAYGNRIYSWNLHNKQQKTFTAHNGQITSFDCHNNMLLSSSADKTVKIWDIANHKLINKLEHSHPIGMAKFINNGKVLTCSTDKKVIIWDTETKKISQQIQEDLSYMYAFASTDQKFCVVLGQNEKNKKRLHLWNVTSKQKIHSWQCPRGNWLNVVCFSPDNRLVAYTGEDNKIYIHDLENKSLVAKLSGHSQTIRSIHFAKNSRSIFSIAADNTIKSWKIEVAKNHRSIDNCVIDIIFHKKRNLYAAISKNLRNIKLWKDPNNITILKGHKKRINQIAFSANGKYLASASADQTVRVWDVESQKLLMTFTHQDRVESVCFHPKNEILASAGRDKVIKLWSIKTQKWIKDLQGNTGWIQDLRFSSDGNTIFSVSTDKKLMMWRWKTNDVIKRSGHSSVIRSIDLSPDGKLLATGSWDKSIILWDAKSGNPIANLSGHEEMVYKVKFTPNGKYLLSASEDKTIKIWSLQHRRAIATFSGHKKSVTGLCILDEENFASVEHDYVAKFWRINFPTYEKYESFFDSDFRFRNFSNMLY